MERHQARQDPGGGGRNARPKKSPKTRITKEAAFVDPGAAFSSEPLPSQKNPQRNRVAGMLKPT